MDGMTGLSPRTELADDMAPTRRPFAFERVIDEICAFDWESLGDDAIMQVANAYYYFSVQFRESLEIACHLYPQDDKLRQLRAGECDTDNLSPWPGVAAVGERLHHDEFMKRLLALQPIARGQHLATVGRAYLKRVRALAAPTRATSIASYEDGGLSSVFLAMLRARDWRGPGARAFKFFLEQHIRFDVDDFGGHGALSRHLRPDDDILPLWIAFRDLLASAVPRFAAVERSGDCSVR